MVKAIDVEQRDVHVDLTLAAISGSFFAPGGRYPKNEDGLESDVCQKVIDNLAGVVKFFGLELTEDASFDRTKQIFFPKTKIHCECQLLTFLHHNPFVPFVHTSGYRNNPVVDPTSICVRTIKSSGNVLAGLFQAELLSSHSPKMLLFGHLYCSLPLLSYISKSLL